jgi:hypothetical protein
MTKRMTRIRASSHVTIPLSIGAGFYIGRCGNIGGSMRTPIAALILVFVTSFLAACGGEGRSRGPDARVVALNAASNYPTIQFLREERLQSALNFTDAGQFLYEVGQYDFNLQVTPPFQSSPLRLKSFSVTLQQGVEHYFVITEVGGLLEPLIVTQAPFSPVSTNAEVSLVHAAPASPSMDIYLTAPGAVLSAANPIGTAVFNQHVAPSTFAPGDYQLSLTEVGNPLNVFFASRTIALLAGQSNFFVIADAGDDSNEVVVTRATNGTQVLVDVNAPSSQRMINGVTDAQPRDVFLDGDFAAPYFAAVPYAAPTARVPIAPGDRKLSVTPAGNSGVIEIEATNTVDSGVSYTGLIAGASGALLLTRVAENRRRVLGEARLRYYDAAAQFPSIGIALAPSGGQQLGFPVVLVNGASAEELPLAPGAYDLTVYISGSTTPVLGPMTITVASEGIYSILFLNGPTAETASAVLFDDFP